MRYLSISGAVVTGLFYFAIMVSYLISCEPMGGHDTLAWTFGLNSPKCQKIHPLTAVALGIVGLVSDVYLLILPLPAVWNLQLPLRRKLAVSAMFMTGSV